MNRSERKDEIKKEAANYLEQNKEAFKGDKRFEWIISLAEQLMEIRDEATVERDEGMGIDSDEITKWCNEAFNEWKGENSQQQEDDLPFDQFPEQDPEEEEGDNYQRPHDD